MLSKRREYCCYSDILINIIGSSQKLKDTKNMKYWVVIIITNCFQTGVLLNAEVAVHFVQNTCVVFIYLFTLYTTSECVFAIWVFYLQIVFNKPSTTL